MCQLLTDTLNAYLLYVKQKQSYVIIVVITIILIIIIKTLSFIFFSMNRLQRTQINHKNTSTN